MKAMTYDQWKAAGYQVKKGEKCIGYNKAGVAVFQRSQVMEQYDLGDYTLVDIDNE